MLGFLPYSEAVAELPGVVVKRGALLRHLADGALRQDRDVLLAILWAPEAAVHGHLAMVCLPRSLTPSWKQGSIRRHSSQRKRALRPVVALLKHREGSLPRLTSAARDRAGLALPRGRVQDAWWP